MCLTESCSSATPGCSSNSGLGGGAGIEPGDVVQVRGNDACKPLYVEACHAVWRAGGHVIHAYMPSADEPTTRERAFYELASDEQLDFLPELYARATVDQIDHELLLIAAADPRSLDGVDPAKQMRHQQSRRPVHDWEQEKESRGEFSWTIGPTAPRGWRPRRGSRSRSTGSRSSRRASSTLEDPVARWREVRAQISDPPDRLNALPIERLHVEGADADLWFGLGEQRRWRDGVGSNIPSFEIYTVA